MSLMEYDGVDYMDDERVLGTVTVLAVHTSRRLAFVKMQDGTIRTATYCVECKPFTKMELYKTGVLF